MYYCVYNEIQWLYKQQADRDLYKKEMQEMLLAYPNLRVVEASVEDIILNEDEKVKGIVTQDGKRNFLFLPYFYIGCSSGSDFVLYCIVLYCIVLYCIVLYCIVLGCFMLAAMVHCDTINVFFYP